MDQLRGLKENVIIGKLIPAGTGLEEFRVADDEAEESEQSQEAPAAQAEETALPEAEFTVSEEVFFEE